jgi:hypothetical protein
MAEATLVTIAYTVRSEKHEEYLSIMKGLLESINALKSVSCALYKVDDEANSYVEVYSCDSTEAYDALEDNLDDASREKINKIAAEFVTTRQSVTAMQRV